MLSLIAQSQPLWARADLIFWGALTLIVVVPVIGNYVYLYRKASLETELKRDMVARGMSADEIERVLAARSRK